MSTITKDLRWLHHYYFRGLNCPKPLYKSWSQFSLTQPEIKSRNIYKYFVYTLSRTIPLINFFYVLKLLVDALSTDKGDVPLFDILGMMLWIGIIFPVTFSDTIMLSTSFPRTFWRTVNACDQIWEKANQNLSSHVLQELKRNHKVQVRHLLLHTFSIDYLSIFNFALSSVGSDQDPTYLYSVIPWKNSDVIRVIYFFAQVSSIFTLGMAWSFILTFPTVIAFNLECSMKMLAKLVETGPHERYSWNDIVQDYKTLHLCTKELNQSRLGRILLAFYALSCLQQTMESYCCFQLIKSGAGWDDYQVLFIDVLITIARVFHGWYGLSRLDSASELVFIGMKAERTRLHLSRQVPPRILKAGDKQLKSLVLSCMTIYPYSCRRDIPLNGISVYLNNIVTAALWP
ncbi:unnamed protein product [Orchesella dallaii]|uniref:Odorant receptor n=1 Tax=Orchesella dallaii TaxID=48710 RepID=A0ABP1R973_9HEXA